MYLPTSPGDPRSLQSNAQVLSGIVQMSLNESRIELSA
jgi:hypothetical protein